MTNNQTLLAFEKTKKALRALELMLQEPVDEKRASIDASIQRFEFTIELFWKLLKRILEEQGVDALFPKDVLKKAYAGGLINNESAWLGMLKDRNLTSHAYDEEIADEVYDHIKQNYPILKQTLQELEKKLELLG